MIPIHMLLDTATDCNILSFTSSEALKHASLLYHLNPESDSIVVRSESLSFQMAISRTWDNLPTYMSSDSTGS